MIMAGEEGEISDRTNRKGEKCNKDGISAARRQPIC